MFHNNPNKEWEKFGKRDPYYSILVTDKYRKNQLNNESLNDFFKTGYDNINFMMKIIREHLDAGFVPKVALDFGCGVARCTIPLAKICQRVIGVDISEAMLNEAKKNCFEQSVFNIEFIRSDDSLSFLTSIKEHFDFIHSFSTFNNISPNKGYSILEKLVESLSENGVAAIEFIYNINISFPAKLAGKLRKKLPLVNNFVNLLYGRPFSEPLMEKNIYDLNKLFLILNYHNCSNLHISFVNHNRLRNVILFFQRKNDTTPLYSY